MTFVLKLSLLLTRDTHQVGSAAPNIATEGAIKLPDVAGGGVGLIGVAGIAASFASSANASERELVEALDNGGGIQALART